MPQLIIPQDNWNPVEIKINLEDVARVVKVPEYRPITNRTLRFIYKAGGAVDYNFATEPEMLAIYTEIEFCCDGPDSNEESEPMSETFETINKNLRSLDVITSAIDSMTYANNITKTITEPDAATMIVTLSGPVPAGASTTKTITFTGDDLPLIVYS